MMTPTTWRLGSLALVGSAVVILWRRRAAQRAVQKRPVAPPAEEVCNAMTDTSFKRRTQFYTTRISDVVDERIVIAMVGLPARGKSYMSKAIMRYLRFLGVDCKLFNAGNKRRDQGQAGADASFFDPKNKKSHALKEQMAMETLDDMFDWLRDKRLACALFDATNTTVERRRAVHERCARASPPLTLVFLESVCNDEAILRSNCPRTLSALPPHHSEHRHPRRRTVALSEPARSRTTRRC
jgi:adenylate kinase family enzyme